MNDPTVHDSTANIFEDMGMPDADEHLAKAEMARSNRKALSNERRAGDQPLNGTASLRMIGLT